MVLLTMCRICLIADIRMESIHTHLQEIYERLTAVPFVKMDGRPIQVCYICYARLRNCQQLQLRCLESEELLTQMLSNNQFKPGPPQDINTLKIEHSVINWSIIDAQELDHDSKIDQVTIDIKVDPLCVIDELKVKDEHTEGNEDDLYQEFGIESAGTTDDIFNIKYDNDMDNVNDRLVCSNQKCKLSFKTTEICIQNIEQKVPSLIAGDENINLEDNDRRNSEQPYRQKSSAAHLKDCVLPIDVELPKTKLDIIKSSARAQKKPKLCVRDQRLYKGVKLKHNRNIINKLLNTDKLITDDMKIHDSNKAPRTEKRYVCDICGKCCNRKNNLIKHTRVHTGERPYKCNICGKCVTTKPILNNHIRIIHKGEKPYKCDICDKCFSKKDSLNSHIRSHTGDIPYKCHICLKTLSTKQNLNNHIRTHTNEKQERSINTHNRARTEIKPYKCDVCDKCFVTKHNLNNHIRIIHIGEKSYRCDICDKCFGVKQSLITHKYLHTGDKPYKCDLCEKCFTTKMNLKNHMYIHAIENPFKCDLCDKRLTTKHNLKKHIRIVHTGERPFKCIICEKCFSNKDNLNTHIRLHTGERPFVCEICEKRFRQQSDFKKHVRIHTGEKPYKCDKCEKNFNTKKNLCKHICIRHTGDRP